MVVEAGAPGEADKQEIALRVTAALRRIFDSANLLLGQSGSWGLRHVSLLCCLRDSPKDAEPKNKWK
jgi:hypothetical protein